MSECVACIPATVWEANQASTDLAWLQDVICKGYNVDFLARDDIETDPNWKQLIPYCVVARLTADHDIEVLSYQRSPKQGDERLRGKFSIGVGGHVNDGDFDHGMAFSDGWIVGLMREIDEELIIRPNRADAFGFRNELLGVIYDPTNAVGQVHLGICYFILLDGYSVLIDKKELVSQEWLPRGILNPENTYENWSLQAAALVQPRIAGLLNTIETSLAMQKMMEQATQKTIEVFSPEAVEAEAQRRFKFEP
jgi:predicted NUDIX family phosphoesterase